MVEVKVLRVIRIDSGVLRPGVKLSIEKPLAKKLKDLGYVEILTEIEGPESEDDPKEEEKSESKDKKEKSKPKKGKKE